MLLHELVVTTDAVTATSSRLAKVAALADLLRLLESDEIVPAVGFLLASPRQQTLGVGWKTLSAVSAAHAESPILTIAEVDAAFEALASASGPGSVAVRGAALDELARRATATEWDLLTRIMRGELRTGALEGVLVDAIARAAGVPVATVRRAAMLSGDLGETARLALTGADLEAVGLQVGRPVLPMLASTAGSPTEALASVAGPASVEFKLDGARIQVHRQGDDVRVFTRNLADITRRVPEIVEAVRSMPVHEAILDGETLSLDEDGAPRAFQNGTVLVHADPRGDAHGNDRRDAADRERPCVRRRGPDAQPLGQPGHLAPARSRVRRDPERDDHGCRDPAPHR